MLVKHAARPAVAPYLTTEREVGTDRRAVRSKSFIATGHPNACRRFTHNTRDLIVPAIVSAFTGIERRLIRGARTLW